MTDLINLYILFHSADSIIPDHMAAVNVEDNMPSEPEKQSPLDPTPIADSTNSGTQFKDFHSKHH